MAQRLPKFICRCDETQSLLQGLDLNVGVAPARGEVCGDHAKRWLEEFLRREWNERRERRERPKMCG